MRAPRHSDVSYFIQSGAAFASHTPFSFDAVSYAKTVHDLIDSPDVICRVDGDPVCCHSAVRLIPNLYNENEIIARVFTTWGDGGLNCFKEVERLSRERGAAFLIADSFIEPRVMRFYKRNGMSRADAVFIKEL